MLSAKRPQAVSEQDACVTCATWSSARSNFGRMRGGTPTSILLPAHSLSLSCMLRTHDDVILRHGLSQRMKSIAILLYRHSSIVHECRIRTPRCACLLLCRPPAREPAAQTIACLVLPSRHLRVATSYSAVIGPSLGTVGGGPLGSSPPPPPPSSTAAGSLRSILSDCPASPSPDASPSDSAPPSDGPLRVSPLTNTW